jgi:hypothetical protein
VRIGKICGTPASSHVITSFNTLSDWYAWVPTDRGLLMAYTRQQFCRRPFDTGTADHLRIVLRYAEPYLLH